MPYMRSGRMNRSWCLCYRLQLYALNLETALHEAHYLKFLVLLDNMSGSVARNPYAKKTITTAKDAAAIMLGINDVNADSSIKRKYGIHVIE